VTKKPRERTARRIRERDARQLVRTREQLAAMAYGGAPERPIDISSPAVVEPRVASLRCPQCDGTYTLDDHQLDAGLRRISVTCRLCHVSRNLWFRLVVTGPN
jgi:hypothetical protein